MTEEQWLECVDPGVMIHSTLVGVPRSFIHDPDWRLKLVLFAEACEARFPDGPPPPAATPFGLAIHATSELLGSDREAGRRVQAALLREILGNPFRLSVLPRECFTDEIVSLAHAAHEDRLLPFGHLDLARLAVVSDALKEAGCTDEAILGHLRSPGPHVRGCWALDLILGRS